MDKYYIILGVSPADSKEDIKKKYKKLVVKHHPDVGGDTEVFKEISRAYQIVTGKQQLSRSELREQQNRQHQQRSQKRQTYRPSKPRYSWKPPRSKPKYEEYTYEVRHKCEMCNGVGQVVEFCKVCAGTKMYPKLDKVGNVMVESDCAFCPPQGHVVLWHCESCCGKGEHVEIKKGTRGVW